MRYLPFDKSGHWFRGNLHTHSTRSDGAKTPAQVCAVYRRRGYDFLSLTDHFREKYDWPLVDTSGFQTKGFVTIPGAELHAPKTSLGGLWHILAVGLPLDFARTRKHESGPQLAKRASAAGAYVAAAHPAWYDLSDRDVLSLKTAQAIEVCNTMCSIANGKGDSIGYLDRLLSQGHRYHAIATDDAHFKDARSDGFQNWVMVRARQLDAGRLLDALHKGHFYSSQGPVIHSMKFTRTTLKISTSPVRLIRVNSRGTVSARAQSAQDFTTADLDIRRLLSEPYARVTVTDKKGRRAWTNPFWW